jgi:hypothetical protein
VVIEIYDDKGKVKGAGSGFLVGADGRILTNYHVIAHTKQATVRLANGDAYDAVDVLDIDKRKDVALIKIKAVDLAYLTLGKSSTTQVGDPVFALGTPLGFLQNSLSQGLVSGVREGDGYHYFQMSAPISPGSSGGPVLNAKGEVIGIAVGTIEEGQNLNFAIPIDYAKGMLSSNQPRSLASIYEPEPEAKAEAHSQSTGADTFHTASAPAPSEEMKQRGTLIYLETKIGMWDKQDARSELGEPVRLRSVAGPDGTVYAYPDPTRLFREIELNFNAGTGKLQGVYGYPWSFTWAQCRQIWGDNAKTVRNKDGTKFYLYRDRRLTVYVDDRGNVISLGVY